MFLFFPGEENFILFQRTSFTFQDTRASAPGKLNVQEHRHFPKSKFFTQNIIAVKTSSYIAISENTFKHSGKSVSKSTSFIFLRIDKLCVKEHVNSSRYYQGLKNSWLSLRRYRSSRPEVLLVKGVLKLCSKCTGENPFQSLISIKLQSNFVEITL